VPSPNKAARRLASEVPAAYELRADVAVEGDPSVSVDPADPGLALVADEHHGLGAVRNS
jgi:hypothetical protein